jgi:hypothetical protein
VRGREGAPLRVLISGATVGGLTLGTSTTHHTSPVPLMLSPACCLSAASPPPLSFFRPLSRSPSGGGGVCNNVCCPFAPASPALCWVGGASAQHTA